MVGRLESRCSTWIIDVTRSLPPSATLNGFDTDLSQGPPKTWLLGNVPMPCLDALETLPQDIIEQFDLVHVRLFMLVNVIKVLISPSQHLRGFSPVLPTPIPVLYYRLLSAPLSS